MSREEPLKSLDAVSNCFNNILQRPLNGTVWHKLISPRYIDGSLTLHIHIYIRRREGGLVGVCWECSADLGLTEVNRKLRRSHLPKGNNWQSVFVDVYEKVEEPKRLIPSSVRLKVINHFDGICGNLIIRRGILFPGLKVFRIIADREVNPVLSGRRAEQCPTEEFFRQLPNGVIKRSPAIGEAITNNRAQEGVGVLDAKGCLDHAVVLLDRDRVGIRATITSDEILDSIQVLLCPDDFEACSN